MVDDIFVVVLRTEELNEHEWRGCMLEAMRSRQLPRMLLVSIAVLPDVGRRYDIAEIHGKHGTRLAILSDLTATDRVVTALKWAGMETEGFTTDDLDGMLTFLDRANIRARMSSMLGPYLDRSWLADPSMRGAESLRSPEANR